MTDEIKSQHELFEVSGKAVLFNSTRDKIVLLHNSDGYWTLPGGHLEENEQPIDAARREIREETSVNYRGELKLFHTDRHTTSRNAEKINLCFLGELDEKTPIFIDNSGDDLDKWEWAPVDKIMRGEYESWMADILKETQK